MISRSRTNRTATSNQSKTLVWRFEIAVTAVVMILATALGSCAPTTVSDLPDQSETPDVTKTATQLTPGASTATSTPTLMPGPGFGFGDGFPIITPDNASAIDLIGIFDPHRLVEVLGSPEWDHLAIIAEDRVVFVPFDQGAPWGQIDLLRLGDLTASASDGQTLALAFRDGGARIYNSAHTELLHEIETDLRLLEISDDGTLLAGCGLDNVVSVWEIESGELQLELSLEGMARSLTFSPDTRTLAVELEGGMFEGLEIWSLESGERLQQLAWEERAGPIYFIRIAPDWSSSVWVSRASVILMDLDSGDPIAFLPHEDFVDEAVYSPDGEMVATTSVAQVDGEMTAVVDLWDVDSGIKVATLVNGDAAVLVAFSPDGSLLASATYDGVIRLWEVESAELLAELGGGYLQYFRMFFSMGGRLLVGASWNGMVDFFAVEPEAVD
jgi:WD40 repeat protein